MSGKGRDLGASVKQRLLDLSRERGEEFQSILTRYGVERLLALVAGERFESAWPAGGPWTAGPP